MFKLGERVFDIRYGWGIVLDTNDGLQVEFISEICEYTIDGRDSPNVPITLYHHDYTPTEQTPLKSSPELLREKFAGMAMQGILSGNINRLLRDDSTSNRIACFALECADELIKALNKKQ